MRSRLFHAFVAYSEKIEGNSKAETLSRLLNGTAVSAANLSPMKADKLAEGHPFYVRMEDEIRQFLQSRELDELSFVEKYNPELVDRYNPQLEYNSIPSLYKGYWVLIQLRSTRADPRTIVPPLSYRTAVLRYERKLDEKLSYFRIFGAATEFVGRVRYVDNKLYYTAKEIGRREEKLFIVSLKAVWSDDGINQQQGIVSGVGHSPGDPEGGVYSSRMLLRQLQLNEDEMRHLALELESGGELKRKLCRYYDPQEIDGEAAKGSGLIEMQAIEAVRIFHRSLEAESWEGKRIFLR